MYQLSTPLHSTPLGSLRTLFFAGVWSFVWNHSLDADFSLSPAPTTRLDFSTLTLGWSSSSRHTRTRRNRSCHLLERIVLISREKIWHHKLIKLARSFVRSVTQNSWIESEICRRYLLVPRQIARRVSFARLAWSSLVPVAYSCPLSFHFHFATRVKSNEVNKKVSENPESNNLPPETWHRDCTTTWTGLGH